MTFPTTPLDVKVELELGGSWTDVTGYTYTRNPITITRGRRDEGSQTDPSECRLQFNNRDGRFSPRNPMSPYYGLIGRNTPLRVSVLLGPTRLFGTGTTGYAGTPDSAGLSITGDIDLRFDATLPSWGPNEVFLQKYTGAGQQSYRVYADTLGRPVLNWSADGTNILGATATVPLPTLAGRQAVRVTLDVDNGAAGRTITFYSARTAAGPWTQLGDPVVQAGTTSIYNSTSEVRVNAHRPGWAIHSAEIRSGIGGSLAGNPIFSAQAEGAASFADAQGNTWTVSGVNASITARRYRFHGGVSNWPPKWDVSGKDVWVPVTAAGVLRRLGQGAASLQSALRRGIPSEAGVVAYWPMEDLDGSTQVASALTGGAPMSVVGTATFAADEEFAGSRALPQIGSALITGAVPAATAGTVQARCILNVPAGVANAVILRLYTTGTVSVWDVGYTTASGGSLTITGYTINPTTGAATATVGPSVATNIGVNGVPFMADLKLTTSGADIAWNLTTLSINDDFWSVSGTVAGSVGAGRIAQINPGLVDLGETVVGHVHVRSSIAANAYGFENYVRGWVPETPGRRVQRLCSEEGVPFVAYGALGPGSGLAVGTFQGMGPQSPQGLLDLIGEAVTTDLGALIEPRDSFALGYRSRESLYTQTPVLELDYGNLVELEPVEDDQASRNDITVTRDDGSSARQVLESGPLSIQAPPDGIGIYDDSVPINIATDAALEQQASWRLHMGTVDEARYPSIVLGLERPAFAADQALTSAALDLEQGDLLTISNPPAWLPPDQIRQIALGFTEVLEPFAWTIEVNCAPASPYDIGVYDQGDPVSRYDTAGSSVDEDLTTTETDVTVVTTVGPVWTQAAGDLPFDIVIGGEEMTVTAVSSSSSPQTFTVTRSVNGVVKAHSSGAAVQLADPVYYAL